MVKLGSERAAGEITDDEFERQKDELFKKADDTVKELEIKSARYQREILTIWGHTAFDKIVDSQGYSDEMNKKVKEFFDLKINTPNGVDLPSIINKTDPEMAQHLNWLMNYNLNELNRQFGLDFMSEWNNLNKVIGDTDISLDEFYNSLEYFLKNAEWLDIDDLFPKMDELQENPK